MGKCSSRGPKSNIPQPADEIQSQKIGLSLKICQILGIAHGSGLCGVRAPLKKRPLWESAALWGKAEAAAEERLTRDDVLKQDQIRKGDFEVDKFIVIEKETD